MRIYVKKIRINF